MYAFFDKLASVYERKLLLSVACSISFFIKKIYLNDLMKTGIKLSIKCKKALVNTNNKKSGAMAGSFNFNQLG